MIPQEPVPAAPEPERAVRLVFEYDNGGVRLVSAQPVDMMVPESDPIGDDYSAHQGAWVAIHDATNRVLFRRVLPHAMRTDVEGPSNEPGYPLTRRPLDRPRGTFVVVIPDLPDARDVSVWHNPPEAERARLQMRSGEVARFALPRQGGRR